MRQSTTPLCGRDRMDHERANDDRLNAPESRAVADSYVRLMAARRNHLEERLAQLKATGRVPWVCVYVLCVDGQVPTHSLEATCSFAVAQGWQVRGCYTDFHAWTDPKTRPGWSMVRRQIRAGFADGVVLLTHSAISAHSDEYALQLAWLQEHFGFVSMVIPEGETAAVQR